MKTIHAEELPTECQRMAQAMEREPINDALAECADVLRKSFTANFAKGETGYGAKWAPRKTNSPGRSGNPGHPLLIDLGELRLSVVSKGAPGNIERVGNRELTVGTSQHVSSGPGEGAPYHVFHQFGTKRMPARPYMDPREEALSQCEDLIGQAVLAAILAV